MVENGPPVTGFDQRLLRTADEKSMERPTETGDTSLKGRHLTMQELFKTERAIDYAGLRLQYIHTEACNLVWV